MSNLTPTPIVDKNGKQTTVHKRVDDGRSAARAGSVAISASSAPIQDDSTGTFGDGTSYTLEGTAEIVQQKYPYLNRHVNNVTEAYVSLDKGDSVRFDVNKENFSYPRHAPDFKLAERDTEGVFKVYAGYKVDFDSLAGNIDENFAESKMERRAVLEGFVRGRYDGVVLPENEDGNEFSIMVPTKSQPHDVVDRPIEYSTEDMMGLYDDPHHANTQEAVNFIRDVTSGFLPDVIRRAFPAPNRGSSI